MMWHPQVGQWGCTACQPVPNAPPCPRCGYASVWHPAVQHWGCDRCQLMNPKIQYLVLPSDATGRPAALTAAIKIVVSVLLIIVTIAIFVAIRL
jgi:hypothetical protein